MKQLKIEGNRVFLDGEEVENLKEYKLVSSARNESVAELTLIIDVKVSRVET